MRIKTYPLKLWISLLISAENKPEDVAFNHYVTVWLHFNQLKFIYKTITYKYRLPTGQKTYRNSSVIRLLVHNRASARPATLSTFPLSVPPSPGYQSLSALIVRLFSSPYPSSKALFPQLIAAPEFH